MLGWLFGGTDAANKTVDSISSGLDKLVYTDEEKGDASREGMKLWIKYQEATQPQNVARRIIAMTVGGVWAFLILLMVLSFPFSEAYAEYIFKIFAYAVTPTFGLITSWYFFKRTKQE